ncbi:hypothetical protein BCR41DRAFT_344167 [Lobosporangium transversale]|uniref:F-box domain-containing protein n=1 Tax=Lobosporangium transversale TaxID=64571 RepID=A0A1Y2H2P8_9FUNG|nr:hypothetical protein BCR41DRAFT_344167 [Lobosporangium transversale]ORZ28840.1 hypothetical protein BCR41DRAFT_344167 [Lobosporangium transversale]|eukprot:XP_021886513.1 hypothetical protein BCR41DRAFT_344167 [Lobosporangium transversale]
MSDSINPLHIPEIILLTGAFLDVEGLLNCIQVSKAFYNILIGLLWRRIVIGPSPAEYPSREVLQKYKGHIEEIVFINNFPKEYTELQGCTRLQSIYYRSRLRMAIGSDCLLKLSNLIKAHHPTITSIYFHAFQSSHGLWKALLECTNLNILKACNTSIKDGVDLFLQVCKKLRHLTLEDVAIHQLPANFLSNEANEYSLPNMHTLCIERVKIAGPPKPYTSWYCLGTLVKRCPVLCELIVDDSYEQYHQADFYRAILLQHPWALNSLSALSLHNMTIEDKDMAALLGRMTGLRQLSSLKCEFGQFSLQELLADKQEILDDGEIVQKARLQRLCETLEILVLYTYNAGIGQAVLSSCPRLKELEGPKITVTEIVNGAEWVCTGLTDLTIILEADVDQETKEGMAKTRLAFRQLGRLTKLRSLALLDSYSWNEARSVLNLRLKTGLDELANLKSLRSLRLEDDKYWQIQLEEATWMVNNWPSIKFVGSDLSDEEAEPNLAMEFLKSHNISNIWEDMD